MIAWLSAFLLTQALEVPIYLRVSRLRVAFAASAFTHPVVWFVFPLLPLGYVPMVACAEVFAVVVEALWLRWHGVHRALLWSFLANAFSASMGLALRAMTGWV